MQRIHKILGICLLVTALVWGILTLLGRAGFGTKAKEDAEASSQDSEMLHERGDQVSDLPTRKFRQRVRKLSSKEASEILKTTIISEINFEDITLVDAVKILNEEISKQTPDGQQRPRILFDTDSKRRHKEFIYGDESTNQKPIRLNNELRVRNIPVSVLLKYLCDYTKTTGWFYNGDFYFSPRYDDGSGSFPYEEKLSRVKLENIDASEVAREFEEIINNHEYFGRKTGIKVYMTEKAHAALLKGELELPTVNLDLVNITLLETVLKISEHTGGALLPDNERLLFDPFDEWDAHISAGIQFDVLLDENLLKPESSTSHSE